MSSKRRSPLSRSLFLKVSLSVGVVVTFTLTLFAYFIIENQKEHLLGVKIKEAEVLSSIFHNGLINFMKEGKGHEVEIFFNLFGVKEGMLEGHILDQKGRILFSSQKTEEGASLSHLLSRQSISGETPTVFQYQNQGRSFLSSLQNIPNGPACYSCHPQDKKILGILNFNLPMESTNKIIAFNRNLLIASTAITLLMMAIAVNLLLNRLVKRPIDQLSKKMAQVEEGHLEAEVSLDTQDELGRLAQTFNAMIKRLSQAHEELEKQHQQQMLQVKHLASLGELAASVAHEIKNPLAGIKLAIQVLAKAPELAGDQRGTIEEIMQSIERLDKTIADLLSYSRIRPPELKPVSLPEVIEASLQAIKEESHIAGVVVEKDFDPTLPPLPLDPQQIERVLLNLFLNALQAMPGGGTLSIQTKRREPGYNFPPEFPLPTSPHREGGWAEVTVSDTGEGIPPEILGEIFRPFFTTKAKGTGLGLSLAQRIIEQHHGYIFAWRREGAGASFSLFLPLFSSASKGRRD